MKSDELELRIDSIEAEQKALRAVLPFTQEEATLAKQRVEDLIKAVEESYRKADEEARKAYLAKVEDIIKAAEESQRKADDEARRAYLAKEAAEQHAKAISERKAQVDVESSAIGSIKTNGEEVVRNLSSLRTQAEESTKAVSKSHDVISEILGAVESLKPKIEDDAKETKNQRDNAETLTREIRKNHSDVKTLNDEATQLRNTAATSLDVINKTKVDSDELARKAKENADVVASRRADSEKFVQDLSGVFGELNKRHTEIIEYKKKLVELTDQYTALDNRVDGLLPHAASASLASAFRAQRRRFIIPQVGWLFTFIVSIGLLVWVAYPELSGGMGLAAAVNPTVTWQDILRQTAHRLPLIVPLVWLAIFAGRNYNLATRLEEDYAYKEAISTAFQGYKREMKELSTDNSDKASPINTLCGNVLTALSQRPGRIYEGKHQDVTPLTPLSNVIQEARAAKDRPVQT